jgi:hypothetical protein
VVRHSADILGEVGQTGWTLDGLGDELDGLEGKQRMVHELERRLVD